MTPEELSKLLIQRKQTAEQEKLGYLERLGMAEGVALTCQWLLDEIAKPDAPADPAP